MRIAWQELPNDLGEAREHPASDQDAACGQATVGGLLIIVGSIYGQPPEFKFAFLHALPKRKVHLNRPLPDLKILLLKLKLTALKTLVRPSSI